MERLTEHYGSYIAVGGTKSLYPGKERKTSPLSNCIVRLAAYEDLFERVELDITDPAQVEELTALVKARDEGRVVVLPCKVGDRAFVLDAEDEDGGEDCIFEGTIVSINNGYGGITVSIGHMGYKCWFSATERRLEDLHTDWFLDEAEAEAALGGGGDEA